MGFGGSTEWASEPSVPASMARNAHCLWCGAELALPLATSNRCPGCSRVNLREDLRVFHTKRLVPRLLEGTAKGLAGLVIGAIFALVVLSASNGPYGYGGAGWAIGLPMIVGALAWDWFGLLTRRESVINYRIFWPALVVGLLALVYMAVAVRMGTRAPRAHEVFLGKALFIGAIAFVIHRFWVRTRPFRFQRARRSNPALRLRPERESDRSPVDQLGTR